MKRSFKVSIVAVFLFTLSLLPTAKAEGELIVNFILPPESKATVTGVQGDSILENTSDTMQKSFTVSQSTLRVDGDFFGARIAMPSYYIYFRSPVTMKVQDYMELDSGSIWIHTIGSDPSFSMKVGPLLLKSNEAEFLAYISPSHEDLAIKVLTGTVAVSHSITGQEITVPAERMVRLDSYGYLIAPLPFEPDLIVKWWEFENFEESLALPVADAGEDQYVLEATSVTLDGLNSVFNDGDVFEWTLAEGPVSEVVYDTGDITKPIFTPPVIGVYKFSLVIVSKDGIRSEPDTVRVFVGENYLSSVQYFNDVSADDPKSIGINYLRKHGVVSGYRDEVSGKTLFYPKSPVTRAQVLKVFFLGSNIDVPEIADGSDTGFLDVDSKQWYAKFVRYAKDQSVIQGNPDGLYRPDQTVNRAAALKIALEINRVNTSGIATDLTYADVPADAWYKNYMAFAYSHMLFDPDSDGKVRPDAEMTRDEVADLMYRLIKAGLVGQRGKLSGYVVGSDGASAVANATVQIFTTKQSILSPTSRGVDPQPYLEADALLKSVNASADGGFLVTLPVGFYSVRVLPGSDTGNQKSFIVEVQNQKTTSIVLETP